MSNFLEKFVGKKSLQEYECDEPERYNPADEIYKPEDNINSEFSDEIEIPEETYVEEIEIAGGDDTWRDYEPEPPPKRRVMGVVKRKPFLPHQVSKEQYAAMSPPPAPMIIDAAIPTPQQYMAEMGMPRYNYMTPRISAEAQAREQVQQELLYRRELEKAQRMEMARNRPRVSTSQKFLNVANQFARGDGGGSNIQIDTTYFRRPKVSVPSPQAQRGESTLNALNNTIRSLAPKVAKKKKR